jgi:hypothetical protein
MERHVFVSGIIGQKDLQLRGLKTLMVAQNPP